MQLSSRELDRSEGIPRPHNLGQYFPMPDQEMFNTINLLYYWCTETYTELKKNGFTVYKVSIENKFNKTNEGFPPSMMSEEELKSQIDIFTEWSKAQQANVSSRN
jgi:hypothetical protein